jgi:hypothetical protein
MINPFKLIRYLKKLKQREKQVADNIEMYKVIITKPTFTKTKYND